MKLSNIILARWFCRVAGPCVEIYAIWRGELDSDGDFTQGSIAYDYAKLLLGAYW